MRAWARFLVFRLLAMLLVSWAALTAVFVMTYWLPADPARAVVGPHADLATVERVRTLMCLDKPFLSQYGCYVGRIMHFDLGTSFRTGRPVAEILLERLGPTAELALAVIVGIWLVSSLLSLLFVRVNAKESNLAPFAAAFSFAMAGLPPFVVGPVLAIVLSHRAHILPSGGAGAPGLDRLWHLVLPTLTLMIVGAFAYTRLFAGELRRASEMPHHKTALAKGASRGRALYVHALPNALGPVIAYWTVDLGALLSGAAPVEYVFGWPGMGREAMLAVLELDLPVVLGVVLVASLAVSLTNFFADLVHVLVDPRLRPH